MNLKNLLLCGLLLAVCACSDDDGNSSNDYKPISLPAAQSRVAEQSNNFSLQLVDATINNQGSENVLISPVSANLVLSMIDNAVKGSARQELCTALGFGDDIEALNGYNQSLLKYLLSVDASAEIYLPNSLWYTIDGVKPGFKSMLSDIYSAPTLKSTRETITSNVNSWVSKNTRGYVTKLLQDDQKCAFAFVNCLYFKGIWSSPFDKEKTQKQDFKNFDGTTTKTDFMSDEKTVKSVGGANYSAISLQFGNGAFSFDIFLPDEGYTTEDVMTELKKTGMPEYEYSTSVYVQIPKMSLSKQIDMIPVMKALGVTKIFNACDFSEMIDMPIDTDMAVGILQQANTLQFDEEKTVVASATVGGIEFISPKPVTESFVVDRPFIFFVREQSTQALLLAGRINKL